MLVSLMLTDIHEIIHIAKAAGEAIIVVGPSGAGIISK